MAYFWHLIFFFVIYFRQINYPLLKNNSRMMKGKKENKVQNHKGKAEKQVKIYKTSFI